METGIVIIAIPALLSNDCGLSPLGLHAMPFKLAAPDLKFLQQDYNTLSKPPRRW